MPNNPVSMRKLKEILRLKYGSQLSHRAIAKSLSISLSVVSRYANRAAQMGIMKWYLSDNAVGFKHFHRHVRAAYQDLAAQLQNGLSYSQLPFINLLVEYQKPFFSTLFVHLDIKPEDNNDTVPFIEEIKRLWK